MYRCTIQRRFVTLIEMMIVMFLIALIAGALAINYGGSLDEGKAFKTKANMDKLEAVLNLEISKYPQSATQIGNNWQEIARSSPIVKDPNSLVKDGWGEDYVVTINPDTGSIYIYSKKYDEYMRTHNSAMR
jgi:general secretion pathway protein G